jgi:hypothetical protein
MLILNSSSIYSDENLAKIKGDTREIEKRSEECLEDARKLLDNYEKRLSKKEVKQSEAWWKCCKKKKGQLKSL